MLRVRNPAAAWGKTDTAAASARRNSPNRISKFFLPSFSEQSLLHFIPPHKVRYMLQRKILLFYRSCIKILFFRNNRKNILIFCFRFAIIATRHTESCPSWSKEHDWKSCKPSTRLRGFESLALRQKKNGNFTKKLPFFSISIVNIMHIMPTTRRETSLRRRAPSQALQKRRFHLSGRKSSLDFSESI